jgi:metal-sulfur cluster biosynthetic enzyme
MISKESVYGALKTVMDPELHINIVDLGLIYDVVVLENEVEVVMTLTTPGCPLAPVIDRLVKESVGGIEDNLKVRLALVWDPPWHIGLMSEEARAELGFD